MHERGYPFFFVTDTNPAWPHPNGISSQASGAGSPGESGRKIMIRRITKIVDGAGLTATLSIMQGDGSTVYWTELFKIVSIFTPIAQDCDNRLTNGLSAKSSVADVVWKIEYEPLDG